jgi:2-polyprenyl-6-methoxyphenol hydroxylase-like FAD-dependent oxidoreductase
MIPQNETERLLGTRLRDLGGVVHRPYTLIDLTQNAESCAATLADAAGGTHTVTARWVVGTDGMHSTVRELAEIPFRGESYARHRIVATMENAPEHPTVADIQALIDARGPQDGVARVQEIVWGTRFRVHRRIADTYRRGRVLLAGDAAHVHSPAGGQGMNTGIQDAVDLGEQLAAVISGRAGEEALDRYTERRHAVAEHVLAMTDRFTRIATARGSVTRILRNGAIGMLNRIPAFRRSLATDLAALNR